MISSVIVIPIIVLMVAMLGSAYTTQGMAWYRKLKLPSWVPPGGVFGFAWTLIYVLTAMSAILFWNDPAWADPAAGARLLIAALFLVNAALNVTWCHLFFVRHRIHDATAESAAIAVTVYFLIILIWPVSPLAAILLLPYAAWTTFATVMAFAIGKMNPRYA